MKKKNNTKLKDNINNIKNHYGISNDKESYKNLKYEYEIIDKLSHRNLIYSLLLGVIVPLMSITIIKDFNYFKEIIFSNDSETKSYLYVYLVMVIYMGFNSLRYLKGIFLIHSQVKYISKYFIDDIINYNGNGNGFVNNRKILNMGIYEILILFTIIILIITEFKTDYRLSNNILEPIMNYDLIRDNYLFKYSSYVFSIGIFTLTIVDHYWLNKIKNSDYFTFTDKEVNNNKNDDYYLKSFIYTVEAQKKTSYFDGTLALIIFLLTILKCNIWLTLIPLLFLFISILFEWYSVKIDFIRKIFYG